MPASPLGQPQRVIPPADNSHKSVVVGQEVTAAFGHFPSGEITIEAIHHGQIQRGREWQKQVVFGRVYQLCNRLVDIVNVLSSSTTFEMGVDVGQLKAVFLRNVPPTPANYTQRAGRAGRRREGTAFAFTYARSTPHDQTHFFRPADIVQGEVPVPRINLANRKLTQRHINSYLLGQFLRSPEVGIAGDQISIAQFFLEPTPDQAPGTRFGTWLQVQRDSLILPITRIINPESGLDAGTSLRQSLAELDSARSMLMDRLDAYQRQRQAAEAQLANAQGRERYAALRNIDSADRLIAELRNKKRLIDYLASDPHWLPGYAFPQDVVKLLAVC
jgi:superfamily II DNA or RNA helicase